LTGLSGAGKTTIANKVKLMLETGGQQVIIIDGDVYRQTLCKDLSPFICSSVPCSSVPITASR
jgi:adenylylsulfate kinase-like enzyme